MLLLVVVAQPANWLRRHGVKLLGVAAVTLALSLTLYVFGDDSYTSNGMSRWERRSSGSHLIYVVAVSLLLLMAATAVRFGQHPGRLRVAAGAAIISWPILWFVSFVAFGSN